MKPSTSTPARPLLLEALTRAFAPGGASSLDPAVPVAVWRRALVGPAAEFLARPGKQLRATFVRAGWALGGGNPSAMPERLPLVLELLHAGSLIIDDIEDDSHERRGAPALHQLIGVPLAINTGSWMYFWALAELAELAFAPEIELRVHRAATATLVRCHQGQALDLAVRITDLEMSEVSAVVTATTRLKTATLCRFAAELGALAAGCPEDRLETIGRFGEAAGIGLQMLDDLGSLTSSARRAKAREDLRGGRPTWPWVWLAAHVPFAWARLAAKARIATDESALDAVAGELAAEVAAIGRSAIHGALHQAVLELTSTFGSSATTSWISDELARMEQSYG